MKARVLSPIEIRDNTRVIGDSAMRAFTDSMARQTHVSSGFQESVTRARVG